ncbi:unnamed protein product [Leptosia nina]|uniref:Kazal-like domain-containing protein n=1 Tax=Leptosia nina TaxID=320188 RepID=A0AAV1JEB8_9NEOP
MVTNVGGQSMPCVCLPEAPVCASDFNTYPGACVMRCAGLSFKIMLKVIFHGTCEDLFRQLLFKQNAQPSYKSRLVKPYPISNK